MSIIYSKTNINRKKEFQTCVNIKEEYGRIFVEKKSLNNNVNYLLKIVENIEKMKKIYSSHIVEAKFENDCLISKFINGTSLDAYFYSYPKETLNYYLKIVDKNESIKEFTISDKFIKIFGNVEIPIQTKSFKVSNIDLIPQNIIIDENKEYRIIDCEWVFDFEIPRDFILYRALVELYANNKTSISFDEAFNYLDIKIKKEILDQMNQNFINHVIEGSVLNFWNKKENFILDALGKAYQEINNLRGNLKNSNYANNELNNQLDNLSNEINNLKKDLENQNIINLKVSSENQVLREELGQNHQEKIFERSVNLQIKTENRLLTKKLNAQNELNAKIICDNKNLENKINQVENELNSQKALSERLSDENRIISDELNHIKNSTSYRFCLKYFKFRDFLFPKNSRRRLFLKLICKSIRHPIWFIKHLSIKNIKKFFKYTKSEGGERALERLSQYQNDTTDKSLSERLRIYKMDKRENYPVLEFTKYKNPLVSIIIPVYNQFSYTYGCLESILENTKNISYEIIIGDDCSSDETSHILDYVKNIKVNRNKNNLRFLLNCNYATKLAKGKYILFINNDTNVQPYWLDSLIETIESDSKIGMVGSKLVYPNGSLQEAGGILWKDGSAWNYGNKSDPDASEYNYRKEADYISGASIMIKSSLWKKIGGFDRRFVPAYCEDSDLAFEVRNHGYKVVYDPFSIVVHYEGISNGTDVNQGVKKYQVENSNKFYEKWKDVLKEHYPNAENVFIARERSFKKKKLLMIDHYVPQYDKDAGSRTVFGYLKLFAKMGYDVKFIGENFYRHEPYTKELQKCGIEVLYGPYYYNHWKDWIKQNGKYFDIVFFNRPHITIKFIDDIKANCPNAKFIYYGHDLHYVRINREYEIEKDESLLQEAKKWKQIEFSLFEKVDLVYYPSIVEINKIKEELPKLNARVLQPYLYENLNYSSYESKKRKNLLFVGGFRHGPNFDGIMWFIKEIYPNIVSKIPDIKLIIAGSYPPQELFDSANKNIVIKGFVSDEELNKLYQQVKMVVIPIRYGAGIKGKVIEAMANNVPVMTTSCGAEGINSEGLIIDETFSSLTKIYQDDKFLDNLSKKEYRFIKQEYTEDSAREKIIKDFKEM